MLNRLRGLAGVLVEAMRGRLVRPPRRRIPSTSGSWLEDRTLLSARLVETPLLQVASPSIGSEHALPENGHTVDVQIRTSDADAGHASRRERQGLQAGRLS